MCVLCTVFTIDRSPKNERFKSEISDFHGYFVKIQLQMLYNVLPREEQSQGKICIQKHDAKAQNLCCAFEYVHWNGIPNGNGYPMGIQWEWV